MPFGGWQQMKGRAMTELHDALLDAVINANNVVGDAEERTNRWIEQRSHLANIAHLNGVSIDEIAAGVGQPAAAVREWLRMEGCHPDEAVEG